MVKKCGNTSRETFYDCTEQLTINSHILTCNIALNLYFFINENKRDDKFRLNQTADRMSNFLSFN